MCKLVGIFRQYFLHKLKDWMCPIEEKKELGVLGKILKLAGLMLRLFTAIPS